MKDGGWSMEDGGWRMEKTIREGDLLRSNSGNKR